MRPSDSAAETVLRAMADAVLVLGVDGKVKRANEAAARLLGRDSLEGVPLEELCANPSTATRSMQTVAQTGDELRREEIDLLSAIGEVIPTSVVASAILDDDGFLEGIVLVARDLRETRRLVAELAAARDHLESRLAETERKLIHAERLSTLGTLAGGIGHELNNVATIHVGALELLRESAPADPETGELLDDLRRAGEHVATHARRLLRLARPGPDFTEQSDLRSIVSETLSMLRGARKLRDVRVATDLPEEPVTVEVNRSRVEQILVNLVLNAADAAGRGGAIEIRVAAEGGRALCEVSDDGPGIDPAALDRIFEPFFTTKTGDEGTGLGLVVARDIARCYGGDLVAENRRDGAGARLRFDLPLATEVG